MELEHAETEAVINIDYMKTNTQQAFLTIAANSKPFGTRAQIDSSLFSAFFDAQASSVTKVYESRRLLLLAIKLPSFAIVRLA